MVGRWGLRQLTHHASGHEVNVHFAPIFRGEVMSQIFVLTTVGVRILVHVTDDLRATRPH